MKKIMLTMILAISATGIAAAQTDNKAVASKSDSISRDQKKGPVYFMNSYDIVNLEEFRKYGPKVFPLLMKYGGEVLASDVEAFVFEGKAKRMNAIIKFPSLEAAYNCYNDPEYREIKKIRINSTTNCTMVLVKQFSQQ